MLMFKIKLTDPKEHNPEDFVYLVHGLHNWHGDEKFSFDQIQDRISNVQDPTQFYRASMIGHLDEEAAKKRFIYHGKISQLATFGNVGLILNPAHDGLVYVAWNCDLGSPGDHEELKKFAEKHKDKVRAPFSLLIETIEHEYVKYNEMIVKGHPDTEVQGVFYQGLNQETEKEGKRLADIVSGVCKREIPVIGLPFKKKVDSSNPEEREVQQELDILELQLQILQIKAEFYGSGVKIECDSSAPSKDSDFEAYAKLRDGMIRGLK